MSADIRDALAGSICMSLRSYRKDGTPVDTPVWCTRVGECFVFYTDERTFKAKRLRRNPQIEIAACDVWGLCSTPHYPAVSRIVEDAAERARYFDAIKEKYGFHWHMSLLGSRLVGKVKYRMLVECRLTALTPAGGAADSYEDQKKN